MLEQIMVQGGVSWEEKKCILCVCLSISFYKYLGNLVLTTYSFRYTRYRLTLDCFIAFHADIFTPEVKSSWISWPVKTEIYISVFHTQHIQCWGFLNMFFKWAFCFKWIDLVVSYNVCYWKYRRSACCTPNSVATPKLWFGQQISGTLY